MISVEVDPRQVRDIERALADLHPDRLLRPELPEIRTDILKAVHVYPPAVAGSRYERTGLLRRSWVLAILGDKLDIQNFALYAGWVQGEQQTRRHKAHGWRRIFDIATDAVDRALKRIERRVDRIWS